MIAFLIRLGALYPLFAAPPENPQRLVNDAGGARNQHLWTARRRRNRLWSRLVGQVDHTWDFCR